MSQLIGQFSIVGDQHQSFAAPIQTADRKQPLVGRYQIDDPRSSVRVSVRADHARRLVQDVVDQLRTRQNDAVDTDFLSRRINARAHFRDTCRSTSTRPSRINSSHSRRLLIPAAANTFCSRWASATESDDAAGAGLDLERMAIRENSAVKDPCGCGLDPCTLHRQATDR
jgi:hypothetical protein